MSYFHVTGVLRQFTALWIYASNFVVGSYYEGHNTLQAEEHCVVNGKITLGLFHHG